MIEKLDGLRIQWKVVGMLIIKEMYRMYIQFQAQRFQKQNIITHNVLIGEIKLMYDDRIDMIIAE